MYVATTEDSAEVAFAVDDAYQGRGLGTILLGQLAEVAHANGIQQFEAIVLPENHRMIDVFRESGFPVEVQAGVAQLVLRLPTSLDDAGVERFERREQVAASRSV